MFEPYIRSKTDSPVWYRSPACFGHQWEGKIQGNAPHKIDDQAVVGEGKGMRLPKDCPHLLNPEFTDELSALDTLLGL
jgi:hypothetical protein